MAHIDCICPPKADGVRHPAGDTVTFKPKLDFREAMTARNAIGFVYAEDPDARLAEILSALTESYTLDGIESWTLEDVEGKPIEVTKPNIRKYLFADIRVATLVSEEADNLYREPVMDALKATGSTSSPDTPTSPSTSATTTGSTTPPPTPLKPSSTTTTPTDGTEMTSQSLVGVSNS